MLRAFIFLPSLFSYLRSFPTFVLSNILPPTLSDNFPFFLTQDALSYQLTGAVPAALSSLTDASKLFPLVSTLPPPWPPHAGLCWRAETIISLWRVGLCVALKKLDDGAKILLSRVVTLTTLPVRAALKALEDEREDARQQETERITAIRRAYNQMIRGSAHTLSAMTGSLSSVSGGGGSSSSSNTSGGGGGGSDVDLLEMQSAREEAVLEALTLRYKLTPAEVNLIRSTSASSSSLSSGEAGSGMGISDDHDVLGVGIGWPTVNPAADGSLMDSDAFDLSTTASLTSNDVSELHDRSVASPRVSSGHGLSVLVSRDTTPSQPYRSGLGVSSSSSSSSATAAAGAGGAGGMRDVNRSRLATPAVHSTGISAMVSPAHNGGGYFGSEYNHVGDTPRGYSTTLGASLFPSTIPTLPDAAVARLVRRNSLTSSTPRPLASPMGPSSSSRMGSLANTPATNIRTTSYADAYAHTPGSGSGSGSGGAGAGAGAGNASDYITHSSLRGRRTTGGAGTGAAAAAGAGAGAGGSIGVDVVAGGAADRPSQSQFGAYIRRATSVVQTRANKVIRAKGEMRLFDSFLLNYLGNLYQASGRVDDAFDAYQLAMGLDPFSVFPLINRAALARRHARYTLALSDYQGLLAIFAKKLGLQLSFTTTENTSASNPAATTGTSTGAGAGGLASKLSTSSSGVAMSSGSGGPASGTPTNSSNAGEGLAMLVAANGYGDGGSISARRPRSGLHSAGSRTSTSTNSSTGRHRSSETSSSSSSSSSTTPQDPLHRLLSSLHLYISILKQQPQQSWWRLPYIQGQLAEAISLYQQFRIRNESMLTASSMAVLGSSFANQAPSLSSSSGSSASSTSPSSSSGALFALGMNQTPNMYSPRSRSLAIANTDVSAVRNMFSVIDREAHNLIGQVRLHPSFRGA